MEHPLVKLMENQLKRRQQHDQNFSIEKKPLQNEYYHWKKEKNPKDLDFESHSPGSE